ncbi:MAG: GAF domain-containing sensor histidine kinase [Ardenticatenaceae bacterium]|nr:GAF domain-containing sensor histidine kinase [Ardenticatenaceae bacterium]
MVTDYRQEFEERNRQLEALNQAAIAIAGELSLEKVLQKIVDSARDLVGARYAALGVPNSDGIMETFVHRGMTTDEAAAMSHFPRGLGLLGAIIRERRPIRVPRIEDDPRSIGFPANHPLMISFLGVPIMGGKQVLGNLYLTDKVDAPEFTAADQEIVEMFAVHAAVAIQNARLYEQVSRLAVVEERARIGMDLHDGIIQSIYAVGLTLESVKLVIPVQPDKADKLLDRAIEGLNDTIRDIRNFILDLRPQRFRGDVDVGISRLVREFQANAMVSVQLDVEQEAVASLPTPVARAIFLTTQEALANIARHARATQVTVKARRRGGMVELMVVDNGRGFDIDTQNQTIGHGLSNMRARTEELQGTCVIYSVPGEGTRIELSLPCS